MRMQVPPPEKRLIWIGSGKRGLSGLPVWVRKFFGQALDFAQRGGRHDAAKTLKGFGGAGVLEVVEDDAGGSYRAVYTVTVFTPPTGVKGQRAPADSSMRAIGR